MDVDQADTTGAIYSRIRSRIRRVSGLVLRHLRAPAHVLLVSLLSALNGLSVADPTTRHTGAALATPPAAAVPTILPSGAPLLGISSAFPVLDHAPLLRSPITTPASQASRISSATGGTALPDLGGRPVRAGRSWRERLWRHLDTAVGNPMNDPRRLVAVGQAVAEGRLEQHAVAAGIQAQERVTQSFLNAGIAALREWSGGLVRSLDARYRGPLGERAEILGIDAMLALWEGQGSGLLGQMGVSLQEDDDSAFSGGLAYRHDMLSGDLQLGINAFYDYLSDVGLDRFSIGFETRTRLLDLYLNWYQALGGASSPELYTPDGFDAQVSAHLPALPWMELSAKYYRWNRLYAQPDLEGQEYALALRPVPLLSLEARYEDPESGSTDLAGELSLEYRIGVPLREQLRIGRVRSQKPMLRRFERVRREYQQRIQRAPTAIVRSDAVRLESVLVQVDNQVFDSLTDTLMEGERQVSISASLVRPGGGPRTEQRMEFTGTAQANRDYRIGDVRADGALLPVQYPQGPDGAQGLQEGSSPAPAPYVMVPFAAGQERVALEVSLAMQDNNLHEPEAKTLYLQPVDTSSATNTRAAPAVGAPIMEWQDDESSAAPPGRCGRHRCGLGAASLHGDRIRNARRVLCDRALG